MNDFFCRTLKVIGIHVISASRGWFLIYHDAKTTGIE